MSAARAAEFQLVTPELCFWQAYEPAVKADLSSCAMRFGEQLVFIDPIALDESALQELIAFAHPELIVLTNGNHTRAAAEYRERFGVPIAAHPDAQPELEIGIDRELTDGELLLDALQVITLPGAGAGELALHSLSGVLCCGDALINLEQQGFSFLPEKYCGNAKLLRQSLRKLLPLECQVLTFAHGSPIVQNARARLQALLA